MPYRPLTIPIMLAWLLLVFIMPTAGAATLTVTNANDSGTGSLREAIATAGAGDTITFAAGITTINLTSDQLSIDKNLTIDGGSGVTVTRQAGSPSFRIFDIASSNTVVILNGLTISNGNVSTSYNVGGGISNSGTLTVSNSTLSGNSVAYGSQFVGGGGIFNNNHGTLTIINSTFSGNSSDNNIWGNGGGIYNSVYSTLTVINSTFSGNSARSGGGIYNNANGGTLTVTNSTFSGNSADAGGGILSSNSTLTVTNSTFSGNSAGAGAGAGIGIINNSTLHLSNTILANSPSGVDCAATPGSTINASGINLVGDGTCSIPGALTGDPQLGPLADNGGPTQTMALLPGSPAINAADDAICAAEPVNGLDQRGVTRPQGTQCDIGAYEFMLTPTTTTLNVDPTSPVYGQTVTLTATVSPTTATGTVSFQDGSTPLTCMGGNQTLNGGTATCSLNSFPVGTYSDLTAVYSGDSTHAASQGMTSLTVNKANTTTTLTSDNPDPSAVGKAVTVNFTVEAAAPGAGTPTGNVTVSDGTDSCTGTVVAGTCNLTFTSVGTKTLTATYQGDTNFNSSSDTESHEVLATTAQGNAGSGTITATISDDSTCIGFANDPSPSFTAAPTPLPFNVTFPYGVFGFTAVCPSNGTGTLTLTLTYPKPLPAGTQYWKFGPTSDHTNAHWYALPATIAGNTITFTLTDGALGDSDLAPNGTIQDPGGPGVSSTTTIPTLSEWALLALAGLLGGLLWQARRRFD